MSASVTPAGRVKNVHCAMMNAKWPIAMVTVIVLAANVNVSEATKEPCAKKVTYHDFPHERKMYFFIAFYKKIYLHVQLAMAAP